MSLPPGFLDELRTRTSLSQVVGRKVMWDTRKSNQGKGDMWAPCPFHQEKSASFHVDDRKGFYYCFGCHAKGDAISFVRETENVGFMEAIQILAGEAGMTVPAQDPKAQEKSDRRTVLAEVMQDAVRFYRLQLKTNAGAEARAYLERRKLDMPTQDRFDIGFAPDARQGIFNHLTGKGIAPDLIIDAGLCARPDDGGAPYDRFKGRIIFPIRDARGRCIGLGGRSMDPNARAKYLNSPETELFDKGRSLYNHAPAREAAGKGQPLIVAEGYMDVIALAQAGFGAAVAPLGTAITQDQLQLMWRISPEPIITLDGDRAGLAAAMRVIDLALPLLEAGKSLRFCMMPEKTDPDDLIKAQGAAGMQKLLDEAQPMVSLLWRRETEGKVFDSPERKAALDKILREAIKKIQDPSIRSHYGEDIKDLRWQLFRSGRAPKAGSEFGAKPRGEWKKGTGWIGAALPALPTTKSSMLAGQGADIAEHLREAVILAALVSSPSLLPQFISELEMLDFAVPDHRAICAALLRHAKEPDPQVLRQKIEADAGADALEKLFAPSHVQLAPPVRDPSNADLARLCVAEELAKLESQRGVRKEISEAMMDLGGVVDEGLTWRLGQAAEAQNRAVRSESEDKAQYDVGPNGAKLSRDERSAFDQMLEKIDFAKGGRSKS
ncbi:DNA primase [Pseudogemmobacter sp. W21_MBD1_M6]|uniref:DNA primase n=1 Tax=Pseudogemmobacter sp. W21_MBD1_M6 TaxID=3240271 RepID=UPI003F9E26E0